MLTTNEKIELLLQGTNISKDFQFNDTSLDAPLKELYEVVYGKEGLEKAENEVGYPKRYHTSWNWSLRIALQESGYTNREIQQVISRVEDPVKRNFLYEFLIGKAAGEEDIELAKEVIGLLPKEHGGGPPQAQGQMILLKHYAQKGDIDNFNATFKLCNTKQRQEIFYARALLVNALSKAKGFEYTLQLVNKKEFGEKFYYALLEPLTNTYEVEDFEQLFRSYPQFSTVNELMKINLYVKSLVAKQQSEYNEERFRKVFSMVMTIDPKQKAGDFRLRDCHLFDMAVSSKDAAVIDLCKKNIISPAVKRDLNAFLKTLKQKP